jgi:hypothetical protein
MFFLSNMLYQNSIVQCRHPLVLCIMNYAIMPWEGLDDFIVGEQNCKSSRGLVLDVV